MRPQYEFSSYDYAYEFFSRMMKERKHLPFRNWLIKNEHIGKWMRITSYTPDYLVPLYQEFETREGAEE